MKDELKISYIDISYIQEWPGNPKIHDDSLIEKSMNKFGIRWQIILQKSSNRVICGHGRLKEFKRRKMKKVPVSYWDCTDDEAKEFLLMDNKSNPNLWDENKLRNIIIQIPVPELKFTGYDEDELRNIIDGMDTDIDLSEDEPPEPPAEAKAKRGEIYQLGAHRLMCGDSTNKDDVDKLMDGNKADMVFTDPPYGMNLDTDWSDLKGDEKFGGIYGNKYDKVIGDDKPFNIQDYMWISAKEQFWFGGDYYHKTLPDGGSWFVWDKREGNRNEDAMIGSGFELVWSKEEHKREMVRKLWAGYYGLRSQDTKKRIHPTQKPVELPAWFLNKFSKPEQIILDLFGGSGTTLIACEQLNRICYMMEIDPRYIDVIIQRWENLTGESAKLISGI